MRRVKLIFISICLGIFLSFISGCETIVYWENLPRLTFPRVVRIEGDNEAIARAVKITQRLVDAKPLPASTIFVMTLTYLRTKIVKIPSIDYRARAFRCAVKDEQKHETLPPSSGCIVLPEDYLSVLSDDALAAIIAHELGHIERGHKTWQGAAEPSLIQWEADEAATDRLHRAGYCAGEAMRKYAFDIKTIYGSGATHPWQHYPKDCKPKDYKDRAVEDYGQALRLNPNDALAFHNRTRAIN
ncbi:MAG: M48 family metalloprotease [Deltaproteobacteria bacterium]|nr:M48 family metalloprotease [Deltaproteobacteria bacterium]